MSQIIFDNMRLETERLTIRRMEEKDAENLFAMVGNQQFCDEDGGYPAFRTMDERFLRMVKQFCGEQNRFAIAIKDTDAMIGILHMMKPLEERAVSAVEIGYGIAPAFQRKGYGSEAVRAMVDYCHNDLKIEMVLAGAFAFNEKSQRMLEKLGFVREGMTRFACDHPRYGLTDMVNYYHVK